MRQHFETCHRCVHRSSPNTSDQERVGLAIRYMSSDVQNIKAVVRERASLICGFGGMFWDLETPPRNGFILHFYEFGNKIQFDL